MKEMNNICLISEWPKYLKERSVGSYYTKAYIRLGIKFETEKAKGVLLCTASCMFEVLPFPLLVIKVPAYKGICFHLILVFMVCHLCFHLPFCLCSFVQLIKN